MRFDLDIGDPSANQITAYEHGKITVNHQVYQNSIIITPNTLIHPWLVSSINDLTVNQLEPFASLSLEVVILGSGDKLFFPSKAILNWFNQQGIGLECMTNAAACRTYSVLMAEQRACAVGIIMA